MYLIQDFLAGGYLFLEPVYVISIIVVLVLLLLLIGAPVKPIKYIGQGMVKLIIGALLLFFLNTLGNQYGVHVPINLITSAISGFLGIPGLVALVAVQTWII
jgi:inhibitor of the pro-sigma K processing machinery